MSLNFNDPFAHGAYLTWDGGLLKFDSVEDQTVTRSADVVEHPVEIGADVTDHYRIKARVVKLKAFISQEPIDPSLYPEAEGSVQSVEYILPDYPQAALALTVVNAVLDPSQAVAKAFAAKPPTRFTDQVLTYSNPIDTLAKVEGIIDDLYQNATLIDVATRSAFYAQHMLTDVSVTRNFGTGTGAEIELELRQVLFVSTDTVAAPPTPKKKKDVPHKEKGKQNPAPSLSSGAVELGKWVTSQGISIPLF